MKFDPTKRIRFIAFGLIVICLVIVTRLFYIQIIHAESFREAASRQYSQPGSLFERGSIFFTTKDGLPRSAATLTRGFVLAIAPGRIIDAKVALKSLQSILPIDEEDFLAKAAKTDDPYEEIAHKVSMKVGQQIQDLDIDGVNVYPEQWRSYPGGSIASHVIGLLGYQGNDYGGQYGIEKEYDSQLRRKTKNAYANFFVELFSDINTHVFSKDDGRPADVQLTIEPTVQEYLETVVEDTHETWDSKETGIMVIEPKTGAIRGMSATPHFDPRDFSDVLDTGTFSNPFVERVYEMGSIFKALTISSALDAGVITAETEYFDAGVLEIDGYTVSNYDGRGRGTVNMQEVLKQSLNTGTVFVEQKMGNDLFRNYMYRFGLDDRTGIDLPNEASNITDNLEARTDIEYATASFGQGIALSPVSMVRALSALANGGTLIKPHVTQNIDYEVGKKEIIPTVDQGRVISRATSEEITRMLVAVVDEALQNGEVKKDRYSIAAKTGTAQIANPEEGGYYDDRYFHSFFGYFPAYDPQFLIFLYTSEPVGVRYASQSLTDPFIEVVDFLTRYYEIPPDR